MKYPRMNSEGMDLLVKGARTLEKHGLVDISVKNGRIAKVGKSVHRMGEELIDAHGGLVLPTFVEPHIHLDKAFLAERVQGARTISEAREMIKQAKKSFTVADVSERAERCIRQAISSGVTSIRTHVDIDSLAKLVSLEALLAIREKFRNVLELQIVVLPQEGLIGSPGVEELIQKGLDMGADVLGGLPEAELTPEDSRTQIDELFKIAKTRKLDLDVHCDVVPFTNNIEYYAAKVIKEGFNGRATAGHLIALSYYDDYYASRIIGMIKRAEMNVVVNPCTMMLAGALDRPPLGRGVTRVKELISAGVNLCFGIDNFVDSYNPFGDFDPLRNGWLLAYQGQLNMPREMTTILRMPTSNSARTLRLRNYGLHPGHRADFNVLDAPTPWEALRRRTVPTHVVKRGRVVAENHAVSVLKIKL